MAKHKELEFFNRLTGTLAIELSEPPQQFSGLLNLHATPDAEIVRLELHVEIWEDNANEGRPLTDEEWSSVAFKGKSISLQSDQGDPVTHTAPNGSYFTVRDLVRAVEATERQTRPQSEWFGGVDVHHIFFEGIHEDEDDVWQIYWGS